MRTLSGLSWRGGMGLAVLLLLCAAPCRSQAAPARYDIDQHSATITFGAHGFGFIGIHGYFNQFQGELDVDPNAPLSSRIAVTVDSSVIDTPWPGVASVLRSERYFDAAQYPRVTFHSTGVRPGEPGHWLIDGALTIRGVTRPEVLDATLMPMDRKASAGGLPGVDIVARTVLRRSEFGMVADLPAVGDEVTLTITTRIAVPDAHTPQP